MVKIAFLQTMPGEILEEEKLAISPDGEFVSTFVELAKELDMAIAISFLEKCDQAPRNTVCLFDRHGVLKYKYEKVHTCVFEAGEEAGVYIGELDLDMLRDYRSREVHGNAYRHPQKYGILIDEEIRAPFIRSDYRK